ncbi:hypothetical protein F7725_016415 [Dissostichus mawsoni]|uniref:Fucolectin tachylectin-4 pentraxin-1 domain-containing protein n=1 Tax=Dissostichus mawsoni TaxID=36200 RepID=A0A7J5Z1J9_DISMA|nr:hypothetical protein F7725_016415 [Dissostichus mawsoni]
MILLKVESDSVPIAFNGNPERAVDGNLASVYNQNSCTHTKKHETHGGDWTFKRHIGSTLSHHQQERLINGAEIRVGNSLNARGNPNPICAVISSIEAGTSKTFECNGMDGQYVTIVIRGREEYLTLCEVEVTGQPSGGKVTQSSIAFNGNPERAVDGNLASVYNQNSCTHTKKQRNPCGDWTFKRHIGSTLSPSPTGKIVAPIGSIWDLQTFECNGMDGQYVTIVIRGREEYLTLCETYRINTVTITNRKDCCSDRINGAEIRVGNSLNARGNPNPICAVISSIEAGTSKTFECNGMDGQYVTIVIRGREEYLTLCEVEVTGQPSGTFDIAKGGKVTQSSIAFNGNPERALMEILPAYITRTPVPTLKNNETHAGTSKTFECNGMDGQYVTIVIRGREEYLTLCEVEVTGTEAK